MRGIAILLVVVFHIYARWPKLVPYGDQYSDFPLFKYGHVGLRLFFLLSGFVILMSLENSKSAKEFIWKRWLRLFPAMLVCSLIVFFTAGFFYERPEGVPSADYMLPGLTFMEPSWWRTILHVPRGQLEGSFWSLYVECKFYVFSAIVYFWRGSKSLIVWLTALSTFAIVVQLLYERHLGGTPVIGAWKLCNNLSFEYYGWFAAGAAFFKSTQSEVKRWLYVGLAIVLLDTLLTSDLDIGWIFATLCVSAIFAVALEWKPLQELLATPVLVFFGYISYPLYLVHENMMVSMVIKLDKLGSHTPPILLPVLPFAISCALAYLIAKFLEVPIKKIIQKGLTPILFPKAASTPIT